MREIFVICGIVLCFLSIFVAIVCLNGACVQYTINSWLVYCDKEPSIKFWHGCLIGIPGAGLAVPSAVITWILLKFLD